MTIVGLKDRIIRVRKRYYCTECEKYHGRAAIQKWSQHRRFMGPEPKNFVKRSG